MSRIFILLFFFQISFGQEKSILEYKRIAYEIINNTDYSVFTTVENNLADSRTMDHFKLESDFTLYFGTTIYSRKVKQIQNNPYVTVHFNSKENDGYVSIKGYARVSNDLALKEKYWKDDWDKFYPTKSNYRVIKVKINTFELISEKHNIVGDSLTWKSPVIEIN